MYVFKSVSLDLTYKCNLRCRHCFNNSGERVGDELSANELMRIAKELALLAPESFCICGGEPLLRVDDAVLLVETVKSISPCTVLSMVSNGLLWNGAIVKRLKDAGLDAVQFSLDGVSNESYDWIRRTGGKLPLVRKAIDMARGSGLRVLLSALPHKRSLDEFDEIIAFAESRGVEELRVQPMMPLGRGKAAFDDVRLSDKEYAELKKKLGIANGANGMRIEWGDPIDHFYMLQEVEYVPVLNVDAYGNILLSPYLPVSIWNLRSCGMEGFLNADIPRKALKHPVVRSVIADIFSVEDLSVSHGGVPVAFTSEVVDLSEEIRSL